MSVITPKNKLSQNEYHAKHGLKKLAKNSLYISLMFGQVLWPMNSAMAAPVFIPGNGVEHTGSNEYTVTDNRAIARWQSFVLGEAETIKFLNQDGIENSILLNLVTSEIGSKIAGELNANNIQFILVDPSGITVANSAKIDVSGLVLSTVGVSETEQGGFKKNKNLLFDSSSNEKIVLNPDANIVLESDATLNLNNKLENVVLIGKDIQNNANIEASGLVAMLATDKATLNFEGSNTLGVSFNALALIDDANFVNNGTIIADRAFLASLAKNQAININKDIKANQIVISGDKIQLASNITKNNENRLLKIGKLSSENASIDINLDAASELILDEKASVSGFDSKTIQAKVLKINATNHQAVSTTKNNVATIAEIGSIGSVENVIFNTDKDVEGVITTNNDATLTASSNEIKTNSIAFFGVRSADLGGHKLTASAEQNTFNVTGENALTAAAIDFTGVNTVAGDANNGAVTTNADADLTTDKNALTTQKIEFIGIKTADLGGHKLTASAEQNTFNVTDKNALTAVDIAFTGVNTVAGDANNGEVTTNADASLTADAHSLLTHGITLSGIKTANLSDKKLTASAEHNVFNVTGENALTAADIVFTGVNTVAGDANKGEVTINADADLTADKNALTTQKIEFIGIKTADLGGHKLTASAEQNTFNVTDENALTAADIVFTGVNTVAGDANNGEVTTNADASLTADAHSLLTHGITLSGIKTANLSDKKLTASVEHNVFNVTGEKALTAADIAFTGVNAVAGNANNGEVTTNADADLTAYKNALNTQGIAFTGIKTADLSSHKLTASAQQNTFNVTDENALTAADIAFTGIKTADLCGHKLAASAQQNTFNYTTHNPLTAADIAFTGVNAVAGNANNGEVTTNANADLTANKNALNTQGIAFTGIKTADLGGHKLAASAEQNAFNVTGEKALTAADINFTGVSTVAGKDNKGTVITNADASLTADAFLGEKENALNTQSITFTGIKTADLGGQTLIGSKSHDSFKIFTNGNGVNANGIEIVNLDRTINVNGTASLSGAQNNTWQLTNTTNTLEDSRDNGFIFIGVNAANLQCETLNASAAQNKFDITGAQKLTAADIDFSNVAEVNAYDNKGYVITNNVAELTDGKNQLKTQWVIINGVDQAYLSNNALKGSATGSTLELISESRVDASGIKFFDFGELDGYENTGALVSKLDAPQWTMTTANSGTVNNINFKAFKTLENSVGDLKLNVGEKVGGVEFKGDNLNFGGNSSLVFNSQNNVTVNSINNINGSLVAKDLNINTTGDVDLKTQIDSITLNANNANLVQEGDLVIHSIDVGRTLNLNSADAGKNNLIAGNSGRINVKAKASLGEQGKWDNIGVNAQPLSFEVVSELALVANTTVAPLFPNGQPPIFNLEGDRSESLLSSHTNALIQNNRVSNDANANLALFEALSPIYIDKNAVAGVHVKDSRLDVPSELEMEMLAALLSKENPTAAGKPNKKKVLEKDDADET